MKNTHVKDEVSGLDQNLSLADQKVVEGNDMVSEHMFYRIRQLTGEGLNQIEIAKTLRLNRKTVAKYQSTNTPPKYKERARGTRADPFLGFEDRAESLIENNPSNSAREIYELLVEEGYKGSERTVSRRVQRIRGRKPKERFFEQSYEPGEQCQFDFKEKLKLPFIDGEREVNLLFGTLPYSDVCKLKVFPYKTYECFIEGVHSFFEKIGGMPKNIRIDNLSPCVSKVLKGDKRLYTKSFQRAIDYYGFNVLPCAPGKGNEKGDVEREIQTVCNRIKNLVKNKNIVFKDWDDANAFLDTYVTKRESESTQERFAKESQHLKSLPKRDEDILCKVEIGTCSSYGTVRVNKTAYSVPDAAIGTGCKIVMGAYDVRIYSVSDRKQEWASHPRMPEGVSSILLEHVLPSLVRKPGAMVRWAHQKVLFPQDVFKKAYSFLKKKDASSAEREYLRIMNLIQNVNFEDLSAALELQLESGEISFGAIRDLVLGPMAQVLDINQKQKPLNPELSQYDRLIPQAGGSK